MSAQSGKSSTAICVLGMHRSGTSTIARAVNLLGAYLGEENDLARANEDNPEGYWERPDITRLEGTLLTKLGRSWDSPAPLPRDWLQSADVGPCKEELTSLITAKFGQQPLWAWKDPRTCFLLPLWREVLGRMGIKLVCVYAVRSPLDVANSLRRRDSMPLGKAFGLWFNYNIAALEGIHGVPTAFLSYDRLLSAWEPELRRCASMLGMPWPADEQQLKQAMSSFIRPKLRHSHATAEELAAVPHPVQELYGLMLEALDAPKAPVDGFFRTVERLSRDFHAYASFFEKGLDDPTIAPVARPSYVQRTWWRWKRSIRKRVGKQKHK